MTIGEIHELGTPSSSTLIPEWLKVTYLHQQLLNDPRVYAKLIISAKPAGAPVRIEPFGAYTIISISNTLEKTADSRNNSTISLEEWLGILHEFIYMTVH